MRKTIYLFLLLILILPTFASALIPINASEIGDTYIKWEWVNDSTMLTMSIDGYKICNFDNASNTFILTGLSSAETHTIRLYNSSDTGNEPAHYDVWRLSLCYRNVNEE